MRAWGEEGGERVEGMWRGVVCQPVHGHHETRRPAMPCRSFVPVTGQGPGLSHFISFGCLFAGSVRKGIVQRPLEGLHCAPEAVDRIHGSIGLGVVHLHGVRIHRHHEAEATIALQHPNIVRAFGIECHNDTHYLVMEYVRGRDLLVLVNEDDSFVILMLCLMWT